MSRSVRAWFFPLCFGLGLLGLLSLRFHQPDNTVDDAYITFRYARNLANGVGFVYNPGERVLGTTTPAYTVLLAAAARLTGWQDFPRLARLVNALLDALSLAVLARLVGRLTRSRWAGLLAGLLLAIDGRLLDFGGGGMESALNLLAILLAWMFFFENRPRLAAVAAGLAVLVRPDGLMLASALFAAWGWRALFPPRPVEKSTGWARLPWAEAGLFLAVVLPWLLYATWYFGQPIPQSVLAKSVVYRLPRDAAFRALLVQLRAMWPVSLPPLPDAHSLASSLWQALPPAGLVLAGLVSLQRRRPLAWALGLYLALFIAFFSLGNPLWLGWYEIPLMPLYQALTLLALAAGAGWLTRRGLSSPAFPLASLALTAAALALAVPSLSRLNLIPWEKARQAPGLLNPTYNKRREQDYRLLADMLAPAAANRRLAAIPEIGAFGYDYPGPVLDTTGLTSPEATRYFPIPPEIPIEIYSLPRQMLFDLRPDLFISFDSFIQATLAPDDPQFLAAYRPALGLASHAAFGVQRLVVYRRADLPLEAARPAGQTPAGVFFDAGQGSGLTLDAYSQRAWVDEAQPFWEATLVWRAAAAPFTRDLLVRVNLLDAAGQVVYSVLDRPGDGLFPTPAWGPGMWLVDRYQLKRPQPEAGPYQVDVTVFDAAADPPLPASLADGTLLAEGVYRLP